MMIVFPIHIIIICSLDYLIADYLQIHNSVFQVRQLHADSVRVGVYYCWPAGHD